MACTSYDGFDETERTVFPDILTEAAKIEDYIQENFGGHIRPASGRAISGVLPGSFQKGLLPFVHSQHRHTSPAHCRG